MTDEEYYDTHPDMIVTDMIATVSDDDFHDLFFADNTTPTTLENVIKVIKRELAFCNDGRSNNLRAAVWFISPSTPVETWIKACVACDVPANSARNRWNEAKRALKACMNNEKDKS
jgi:hypothetical protein